MPNYIHSLDAALLHIAFKDWNRPIGLIHDCALVRACDVDDVRTMLINTMRDMYSNNDCLNTLAEAIGGDLNELSMPEDSFDLGEIHPDDGGFAFS